MTSFCFYLFLPTFFSDRRLQASAGPPISDGALPKGSPSISKPRQWTVESIEHLDQKNRIDIQDGVVNKLPQEGIMFGSFIKDLRIQQRIGLREFCLEHGHDPSNWSKIERGVLPPPRDEEILREWAAQLGIKRGSDDWLKFFEYAAVDTGRIPDQLLRDEKLVEHLPLFFRTLSGQKPSREDLEKLMKLIKGTRGA